MIRNKCVTRNHKEMYVGSVLGCHLGDVLCCSLAWLLRNDEARYLIIGVLSELLHIRKRRRDTLAEHQYTLIEIFCSLILNGDAE